MGQKASDTALGAKIASVAWPRLSWISVGANSFKGENIISSYCLGCICRNKGRTYIMGLDCTLAS